MVDQSIRQFCLAGTDPPGHHRILMTRKHPKSILLKIHSAPTLLLLVLLLSHLLFCKPAEASKISENDILDEDLDTNDEENIIANTGFNLEFTQDMYDVVIPENSLGRVYAVPSDLNTKMGIALPKSMISGHSVRFRIRSGDQDGFFKAEAEQVGDFVFLLIRTRTNTLDVLNRERRDSYQLEIRTRIRDKHKNRRLKTASEASTIVRVTVKDVNDLDPFFSPSSYAFVVPEDTPLHQVCLYNRVTLDIMNPKISINYQNFCNIFQSQNSGDFDGRFFLDLHF